MTSFTVRNVALYLLVKAEILDFDVFNWLCMTDAVNDKDQIPDATWLYWEYGLQRFVRAGVHKRQVYRHLLSFTDLCEGISEPQQALQSAMCEQAIEQRNLVFAPTTFAENPDGQVFARERTIARPQLKIRTALKLSGRRRNSSTGSIPILQSSRSSASLELPSSVQTSAFASAASSASSAGTAGSARRARWHSAAAWRSRRDEITRLYMEQNLPLEQVQGIMELEGFRATKRQYKRKFEEWGLRKNVTLADKLMIIAKQYNRKQRGKSTVFRLNGKPLGISHLKQILKGAKCSHADLLGERKTPPHITYFTPTNGSVLAEDAVGGVYKSDTYLITESSVLPSNYTAPDPVGLSGMQLDGQQIWTKPGSQEQWEYSFDEVFGEVQDSWAANLDVSGYDVGADQDPPWLDYFTYPDKVDIE